MDESDGMATRNEELEVEVNEPGKDSTHNLENEDKAENEERVDDKGTDERVDEIQVEERIPESSILTSHTNNYETADEQDSDQDKQVANHEDDAAAGAQESVDNHSEADFDDFIVEDRYGDESSPEKVSGAETNPSVSNNPTFPDRQDSSDGPADGHNSSRSASPESPQQSEEANGATEEFAEDMTEMVENSDVAKESRHSEEADEVVEENMEENVEMTDDFGDAQKLPQVKEKGRAAEIKAPTPDPPSVTTEPKATSEEVKTPSVFDTAAIEYVSNYRSVGTQTTEDDLPPLRPRKGHHHRPKPSISNLSKASSDGIVLTPTTSTR
jgi:X-linked retinitis pigmentosa GTPase regulator